MGDGVNASKPQKCMLENGLQTVTVFLQRRAQRLGLEVKEKKETNRPRKKARRVTGFTQRCPAYQASMTDNETDKTLFCRALAEKISRLLSDRLNQIPWMDVHIHRTQSLSTEK
ncbi:hypothetical protein J6590_058340 [Homalodisca vitripennis]|nr:hypothetical protein J6590_058340 [Homalodisca vitripennis]